MKLVFFRMGVGQFKEDKIWRKFAFRELPIKVSFSLSFDIYFSTLTVTTAKETKIGS